MNVDLTVFEDGATVFHESEFALVKLDKVCEVSPRSCSGLSDANPARERLVVAECSFPETDGLTFSQEHQITYTNSRTGFCSSLLYDQRPVPIAGRRMSPIVLLAPKVWLSRDINTLISFSSWSIPPCSGTEEAPLQISVLSPAGESVAVITRAKLKNSGWILDLGHALANSGSLKIKPEFFSVVARGGAGQYAIMTFVINNATGSFALEHSLPPNYYMDGDLKRVRDEGARFTEAAYH
ncbi:MAG: hypothetical protein ABR582_02345 [Gemmatimonadaceae bacterium]